MRGDTDATMAYAHSRNQQGNRHLLLDHLITVAQTTQGFAEAFGAAELGWWVGLWHDLGKYHPEFQQYLLGVERDLYTRRRGPDHKAAGAKLAAQYAPPLTQPIVGHHGGLRDQETELRVWLNERLPEQRVNEALAIARSVIADLEPMSPLAAPPWLRSPLSLEFFLRMLFSALVDADFLDTEAHFDPGRYDSRRATLPSIPELTHELEADQRRISGKGDNVVADVRHSVYLDCLNAAIQPPGFFRLSVPTGGGKTRSGLAFALRHAAQHDLKRVIVAIPYTSITDQTAATYRSIFQSSHAVLEHHSAIQRSEPDDDIDRDWERLAAKNWDAPIVVTTTVQLFESLLGKSTRACRKLHNIANSVIILDEVQTLPERLLAPILDVLRELVTNYGVTVVLSTATQPAIDASAGFRGLPNVRQIVSDPIAHFDRLKRVVYHLPAARGEQWAWERAADEMRTSPQSLAIVNTKSDALALLDVLGDPDARHLSTLLCGAHRRDVLSEVKDRLHNGEPCRVVATQVVEAGVDLDFPLVLRAVGPLDRIVQAAGRCNREGKLESGRVVVFQPEEGYEPPGAYRTGTDIARAMLSRPGFDFHDPAVYWDYFRALYDRVSLDAPRIQEARANLEYSTVAERFRLIADDTASVLVRYWTTLPDGEEVDNAIDRLRTRRGNPRLIWRLLQPLIVNVRSTVLSGYAREGLAAEIVPGLWEWLGEYDRIRGLVGDRRDPEALVI